MSSETPSSASVIALSSLSKKYPIYEKPSHKFLELVTLRRRQYHKEFWALRDIHLEVPAGTTLGVIGQNGSGKSTLLQIVAGILRQTRGDCRVQGKVAALLELGSGFNPEFTGRENVYMNGAIIGLTRAEMEARIADILDFAEIGEFIDQPVKTYSSGMFMRLAFAVAIHVDPDILLVDEALAVGDIVFQHRCINRINQLRRQGRTILFVTHDLGAVVRFCDRAILLDHGEKLEDGKPETVVQRYQALIFERERRRRMAGKGEMWTALDQDDSLPIVNTIPYVHNRFGERRAEIIGIIMTSLEGEVLNEIKADYEVRLVVSARFHADITHPIVGVTVRDRLGVEICSSNTGYENMHLPPVEAGRIVTVGFRIRVPQMRPGSYSFSPAVAQGNIWEHTIEDWIDNALIVNVADTGLIYGMMRWPVEISYKVREG
jgi:ABC-type polysaccharide/polyol phosphate transport system ATPase subunit